MAEETISNLVITGDSLYHRRIHDLLKELNYFDIKKQYSNYVSALDNLATELFPKINNQEFLNKRDEFYNAIDQFKQNENNKSKVNKNKLTLKAEAFLYLKKFSRELIYEAHCRGLFLRETKERTKSTHISKFFEVIDI